jgi:hypothetical protein
MSETHGRFDNYVPLDVSKVTIDFKEGSLNRNTVTPVGQLVPPPIHQAMSKVVEKNPDLGLTGIKITPVAANSGKMLQTASNWLKLISKRDNEKSRSPDKHKTLIELAPVLQESFLSQLTSEFNATRPVTAARPV